MIPVLIDAALRSLIRRPDRRGLPCGLSESAMSLRKRRLWASCSSAHWQCRC